MKFFAGVALACFASVAGAATTLIGGGATLPARGYTGSVTGAPIGSTSLFGVYMGMGGNPVSYCLTGSGAGKKILAGNDPTNFQVNLPCGIVPPFGFGGSGLTQPHFAGSDAPLSVSEFNAYVTGHGAGTQPVQLPAIAGAIAIVFHKDAQGSVPAVTSMTLTEAQICGIFSGEITMWNDPALAGASIPTGTTGNINVVYRSDNSGTSFSFLNHLSAVCPTNVSAGKTAAVKFKTNQSFTTGVTFGTAPTYLDKYASRIPLGGANSNAGVVAAVSATNGSIGYAEVANGIAGLARFASVKNSNGGTAFVNPSTGFGPTSVPVTLMYDQAIADAVDGNGRPIPTPLSTTSQCIALVDPSSYANPATGYPIVAVTYLLANAQGTGTDATAVRDLLFSPYNLTIRPLVGSIGRIGTGYAWLSSSDLLAPGIQTRINGCVN